MMTLRHEFALPGFTEINGVGINSHEMECAVEIEPDSSVGNTSWYIDRCYVQGFVKRSNLWFEVPKDHPLFRQIEEWAYQEHRVSLVGLWDDYLEEHPKHPRQRSDADEHGTYWGRP